MDFFAAKAESATPGDDVDGFAQAIADRFKHSPVFTANLNAPLPNKLSAPSSILPPETFKSISPKDIQPYLDDPSTLFIDIRSHAAYASTRLPNALSLSVPSTLLKRPLFPLERLATMLPSLSARNRFKKWRQTSKLVVYDADSSGTQSGHLPEGNNILGLLRKFASDSDSAYKGQLLWLKGGFQGVWKECRDLVDTRPVDPDADDDETSSTSLRPNNLPMSAFGSSSTTVNKSGLTASSLRPNFVRSAQPLPAMAFNPFFDTIRQNVELSQGITERIPLKVSKRVRRRLRDLPFNWLREIGRRADIKADNDSSDDDSLSESPDRLSSVFFPSSESLLTSSSSGESSCSPPDRALVDEGMEALAMQFYRIELAEQKRLMGVMQHHTKESGTQSKSGPGLSSSSMRLDGPLSSLGPQTSPDSPFPYSITAGIEKGAKNRYRHIWPFEHARVRLHKEPSPRQSRPQISPTHSTFSHTHNSNDISLNLNSNLNPSGSSLHNQTPQNFNSSSSSHSSSLFEPTPASSSTTSSPSTSMRPPPPSGPLSGPGRPFTLSLPSSYSSSLSASRPYAPPGSPKKSVLSSSASGSPVRRSTTRSPRPNARGLKLDLGLGGDGRFANGAQTFGRSAVAFGGAGRFGGVGSSGSASTNGSGMQMSSTEPRFTQMRGGHGSGGSGGESAIESSATESEREHEFEDGYQSMSASTSTGQHIGSGMEGKRYGSPEYDDYVNASYVQPLCTTRRYIATQGPLEATFTDFWTIVYQQNVHVIVMLTREIEGSMVKCGSYWKDEVYGSLRLKLIDVRGSEDDARTDMRKTDTAGQHSQQTQGHLGPSGFKHDSIKDEGSFSFFPTIKTEEEENKKREKGRRKGKQREERKERRQRAKEEDVEMDVNTAGAGASDSGSGSSSRKDKSKPKHWIPSKHKSIIKRTFLLSHTGYPHIPPRKVVQFQYLGWPDMNVPEHPTGLLSLINQVDKAVEAAEYLPGEALEVDVKLQNPKKSPGEIDRSTGIAKQAMGKKHAPVLLHCSAGVGRTGGYIVVDAVLDGLRREYRQQKKAERDAEKLSQETQKEMAEERVGLVKLGKMDVELGSENRKDEDMEVDSTLAEFNEDGVDDINMTDGTGSNSRVTPDSDEPTGGRADTGSGEKSETGDTIAVLLNNGSNVLHIPQYGKGRDAASDASASSQPPSSSNHSDVTNTPQLMDIDQRVEEMWTHPSTTRGWAEDVSDQTGRHGSAFRVDQARSAFQSQSRLSERDVPQLPSAKKKEENEKKQSPRAEPGPDSEKPRPSSAILSFGPQSVSGSASTSNSDDDSYGFDSAFQKGRGHKHSQPVTYGVGNLSSFGTSVSSLPLGSTPLKRLSQGLDPVPAEAVTSRQGGNSALLPASDIMQERARTHSDPSPRPVPAKADEPRSDNAQLAAPSTWMPQGEAPLTSSPRPASPRGSTPSSGSRSPPGDGSLVGNTEKLKEVKNKLLGGIGESSQVSSRSGVVSPGSGDSVPPLSGSGSRSGSGSGSGSGSSPRSRSGSAELSGLGSNSLDMAPRTSSIPQSLNKADLKLKEVAAAVVANEVNGGLKTDSRKDTNSLPTAFDYTAPRTLHQDASPKALSTFREPLWEVVQDMRQQRMSLCQSLRQYVFVHAAILEGALMIVDEDSQGEEAGDTDDEPEGEYAFKTPRAERKNLNLTPHPKSTSFQTSTTNSLPMDVEDGAQQHQKSPSPINNVFPTISIGKRLASPTELPEEDKRGRQLLHKKPSLKRKYPGSSSSNEEQPVLKDAPLSSSPSKTATLHPQQERRT